MELPPFPNITTDHLQAIGSKHGLKVTQFTLLPQVGIFNKIYRLDESWVLRISRDHPRSFTVAETEAMAVPLARAASVRTPALLVCDISADILPVPYTIYERVPGETLGLLNLEPHDTPETWRELGRDLARLHSGVPYDASAADQAKDDLPDPRAWPNELAAAGLFTAMEASWLSGWLDQLAPAASAPVRKCFRHGDIQTTNIMVSAESLDYLALIDWGSAHWGDPAFDFGGKPLRAVPYTIEGYRQITPLENDETAEARILWRHLQLALHNLWREPEPDLSWAERPLTFIFEVMRFLLETPDDKWRRLISL